MKHEKSEDRHQAPSYPLRLPVTVKSRLTEAAVKSHRSLNGEIVNRLEKSLAENEGQQTQGAAQ